MKNFKFQNITEIKMITEYITGGILLSLKFEKKFYVLRCCVNCCERSLRLYYVI